MNIPEDSALSGQPVSFSQAQPENFQSAPPLFSPDNPPWGLWQAILVWMSSVVLLWLVPQFCALPYVATHYRHIAPTKEILLSDKTFVLILVAAFLPTHVLTLALAWAVATRVGKFPLLKSLGFSWPRNFGLWKSVGLAILLFMMAMAIIYKFGQQETELERILRSSRAAAILTALVAAVTAPLVEEIIYRGILYSALQRIAGAVAGVVIVTSLFAGLHVLQYWPNAGAIAAISILSLVLTIVRALTGRLLPCYIIHLVFNGIQSIIIILDPYVRSVLETPHPDAASALLYSLLKFF